MSWGGLAAAEAAAATVSVLGAIVTLTMLPETKGKSFGRAEPGDGRRCANRVTCATARSGPQRLLKIADQIVRRLKPDRQADDVGAGAGGGSLLVGELAMGGRGRVQDEAAGVADIGEMREQVARSRRA